MITSDKPMSNPMVVFREEFDDWAVLFDPETGDAYGLNPISAFIWKQLDGRNSLDDILVKLRSSCDNIPEDAECHMKEFIDGLSAKGLVGYEYPSSSIRTSPHSV